MSHSGVNTNTNAQGGTIHSSLPPFPRLPALSEVALLAPTQRISWSVVEEAFSYLRQHFFLRAEEAQYKTDETGKRVGTSRTMLPTRMLTQLGSFVLKLASLDGVSCFSPPPRLRVGACKDSVGNCRVEIQEETERVEGEADDSVSSDLGLLLLYFYYHNFKQYLERNVSIRG